MSLELTKIIYCKFVSKQLEKCLGNIKARIGMGAEMKMLMKTDKRQRRGLRRKINEDQVEQNGDRKVLWTINPV